MKADYRVFTFGGKNAKGTAHAVYLRSGVDHAALKASSLTSEDTLVLVAPCGSEPERSPTEVRFFANGHEVTRCGSGTLAAAWALAKAEGNGQETIIQLATSVETVRVVKDGEAYGYTSTPLPQTYLENIPLWEDIVRSSIVGGALCGGAADYTIAELASEEAVVKAVPDLSILTHASQRALILTAKSPDGYVLRYFAPQHGIPEASATGSANVQLLRYWYNRNERVLLFAKQCSKSGGEFWGIPGPGAVQLFGRVKE